MKNKLNRFHNTKNKYNYSDYTVGWICALGKELAAARSMLDKEHECLPSRDGDKNGYVFGQIGDHNVVLTCLPMAMMGNNPATAAAVDMLRSFPSIKHGLMVGIGGGVPSDKHDIRLGDVVVSVPTDQDSGVVQYDFGKTIAEGRFIRTGTLNKPPIDLLTALQRFISTAEPSAEQILQQHVDGAKKNQARRFEYPGQQFDRLFDPAYDHQETSLTCEECNCDANRVKRRPTRPNTLPRIFRGTIASGNQVMKHGRTRDQLAKASNILCFDMEAAGLMDRFPCLVIRGISDYADSHKNDCWQDYAAVVAAAFAKALLLSIRAEKDSMSIEDQLLKALLVADGDVVPNNTRACPETCNWILDHAAFRDWKNAQSITATLWIKGGPGCGKSVMSSFVVEELQRHFVSDEESLHPVPGRTVVARHFCGDKNDPRHASTSILKSLLYEILSQDQALLQRTLLPLLQIEDPAVSEQGGPLNTQMFELFEFLKKTLEAVANDPTIAAIYFIVDGLDRCGVHALEFLQLINQGPGLFNGKASLRCLISSRPSDFLNRNMQPQCIIDLSKENRQDINTVVKLRMKDLQELYRFPDDLRDRIEELLRERSDGMFLWLSLVLDRLRDLTIWDEMIVKEKLQSIPFDVNAIYSNVLECARKESDETASRLQTLLMWVYLAAEPPLKVDQIQIVWALQDGDKSMEDVKGKHQFLKLDTIRKYIRECWSTLIVLRDDDTLWLSHQSVKDFLRHLFSGHGQEQMPAYGITVQEAHERMASTCLTYLCLNEIRELTVPGLPINSDGMIDVARREILVKNYLNGHHLLGYSILFLGLHLRESKMDSRQVDIPGMDSFLAAESGALKKWVRAYDLLKRSTHGKYMGAPNSLSLLFISARLNLVQLAKYSIASKVKIPGMSPLTVSIQPITAMPDLSGWNAIHIAADSESVEMLEWLLTKGADADTQTVGAIHPGCTALHFAAMKRGDAGPRMVTALLDRGANPNFRTMLGGNTPLHYAVNGSPVNTERLLLHPKNRANPNIANSSGITALHKAAAVPGLHAIVEELLKHGADPEQKTTTGLISAVRGLTNITASFASNGSWDIACGIVTAQTPLHIAAKAVGTERTMEVLLRKGAKPDTTDSEGQTPLHVALQSIDYEIHTELLVKSGAAVNVRDKSGRTPLCLFMQKICQTLVGTPQGSQKPFLSAYDNVASLERILGTLLDAGADPLETDNDGKSATDYAMQAGIEWAVRKLGNVAPRRIEKLPIMLTLAASEPEPKLQRRFTELSSTVKKQGFRLTRGRP